MPKALRKRRVKIGAGIIVAFFLIITAILVKTQLVDGEKYKNAAQSLAVSSMTVKASRGAIFDCNGNPLVTNRQGNSLVFKYSEFPDKQAKRNEVIASLISLLESNNFKWVDILPVVEKNGKFTIDKNREDELEYLVSDNMLSLENSVKSSADECLDGLIERYGLESYSRSEARKIASVCFGMKYKYFSDSYPYVFAEDVSTKLVSQIMERSTFFTGVEPEAVGYREYTDVTAFSHVLGVVGSISAEEYETEQKLVEEKLKDTSLSSKEIMSIKSNAYSLNDEYGKSGIEGVMEDELRGKNGIKTVTTGSDGSVKENYLVEPQQGNAVFTTIDSGLQKVAYEALADMLDNNQSTTLFGKAGALVVMNVKTGEVLADVSLPTYDITRYFLDYDKFSTDNSSPLWNRSLQSAYAPGSTFKPLVSVAGLEEGVLTQSTTFDCTGTYRLEDQVFGCLGVHGYINVTTALQHSCNIFYYETGKMLGIDKINKYCNLFGLGKKTGIELPEASGAIASIANKEANGQTWNPGDTVQAAIGQSDHLFTPLQLANYCATIANGGNRMKPFIIKSVLSADMSKVVCETEPMVVNKINVSQRTLDLVRQGMHEVVTLSSPSYYFANCVVDSAGKTGTSQVKRKAPNGEMMECTNGFFIGFAPFDDPEIAVAIVAENALSGSRTSQAAVPIYNYYFGQRTQIDNIQQSNTLIP